METRASPGSGTGSCGWETGRCSSKDELVLYVGEGGGGGGGGRVLITKVKTCRDPKF